jgi:ABC-type lipoprotein release transport system permease subunit
MFRFAIQEFKYHWGRFVATLLAIAISVGFMVAAAVITETAAAGTASDPGLASKYTIWKWTLWIFAGIAMIVGMITISNTFTILLAGRRRQIALLRAIGASGSQIRGSIFAEALLLGLAGALTGAVLGIGVGLAIAGAMGVLGAGPRIPIGDLVNAGFLGLVITMVAAFFPTLRSTRIAPLEALRTSEADPRRRLPVARLVICLLLAATGGFIIWSALQSPRNTVFYTICGAVLLSVGILFGAPLFVPLLLRPVGVVAGLFGPLPRLAARNLIRNPRRVSATAAALMLTVGLIVTLQVGTASVRQTILSRTDDPQMAATLEQALAVILAVVTALLAVAVLIALVGVANTLTLSVLERRRESALMRALGLQKSGLRAVLLLEALLLAGVGSVVGVAAGAFFGWVGVTALARDGISATAETTFALDWPSTLALLLVTFIVAGLASVLPGHRAASAPPVEALADI